MAAESYFFGNSRDVHKPANKPIIVVEQNLKDLGTSFPTGPLQSESASIRKFSALRRWYKINVIQHDCVWLG